MTKTEARDRLDGWCNYHQCSHPEDKGKGLSPSRHDHLEPTPHRYQWFIDNPECWAVHVPPRRERIAGGTMTVPSGVLDEGAKLVREGGA